MILLESVIKDAKTRLKVGYFIDWNILFSIKKTTAIINMRYWVLFYQTTLTWTALTNIRSWMKKRMDM